MKDKKLRVPKAMRDPRSLEENQEGSDSESDQDQVMNYLPSASPSRTNIQPSTCSPPGSAIDMLIQRSRNANPKFDSDNSYHFSDEDETTVGTAFEPIELLYSWVKRLQSHEKKNQELLKKLHTEARQHRTLRTSVVVLCAVTVFLSVANIGTSLAAARLSRDTTVVGNDLVSLGGVRLGTTSKDIVVDMKPWEAGRRRGLQIDSNDTPEKGDFCTNAPTHATCHIGGTITSSSAALLYESFCPGFQELGYCSGEGVERLILNCNGRMSMLFGGLNLPPTPPTDIGGFMAYPSDSRGYVGKAAVYLFGRLIPCTQEFTVGMYCPTEEENRLTTMSGEITDECLVFVAWEPGVCLGKVELCGTPTVALS